MHIALPIGKSNMLMANDVPEIMGRTNENENRSKIVINTESKEEADKFIAEPGASDAVRLRLWDDLAKQPSLQTPGLSHYMQIARRCALTV